MTSKSVLKRHAAQQGLPVTNIYTDNSDKENDLIDIAGIPTKRIDARIILDHANTLTADLEFSTDIEFAKNYFCIGWQACNSSVIANMQSTIDEQKALTEKLREALNDLTADLSDRAHKYKQEDAIAVVACGNSVWRKALAALALPSEKG